MSYFSYFGLLYLRFTPLKQTIEVYNRTRPGAVTGLTEKRLWL